MTKIALDYNIEDVSDGFETVPVDDYMCKMIRCELTKSSNNNNMLAVRWEIMEGDYAGRYIFDNVVLYVQWKVKQYCKAAGVDAGSEFDSDDFLYTEAVVRTDEEGNVKRVKPIE